MCPIGSTGLFERRTKADQRDVRIPNLPSGGRVRLGTRRSTSAVALDIGADAVVALPPGGADGRRVRHAIVHPLPVGLVVDGEVVDSDGLAQELRSMFEEHSLPREVHVGLAHPRLMVRLVELPSTLEGADLDGAVRHLATDLLPVGLDQLVVDYRRLGGVPGGDGAGKQRVLMAAARVDGIDRLTRALDAAGLRSQGIALSGLAMVSALNHAPMPGEAILYVQAGALTNVVITEDGQPLLVRAASAGSEAIATGLAERAGISHEAARAHIANIGLGNASAATSSDDLETNVAQQVREGLRRVIAEVQSSRGVYAARPDACAIGGVVLTGSMTTWPGVAQALEDELHLPVIVADRENWPQIDGLEAAPERLDVVVGLSRASEALRPDLRPTGAGAQSRRVPAAAPPPLVLQIGCGMLALVAAAIVYMVILSNQVSGGREDLRDIATNLQQSEQKAASLKPYSDFAAATQKRHDAVASVAKTRFKWDRTMTELARVAPDGVWLTSAKATLTPTSTVEGGAAGNTSGLRSVLSSPAVELAGCAASEKSVPSYIDRLHLMTGVIDVGFSRTQRTDADGATSAANTGPIGTGGCTAGKQKSSSFELVTYFKQQSAPLAAAGTTTPTPATGATAVAPTTTTPATAPANQTAAATTGG
jgi:type IV pilus assembly protein PilM